MRGDSHIPSSEPFESFEAALRRENEQIHPSDDLAARIEMRLDESATQAERYRLVTASSPFHRRARRLFLSMAALIAIGVTASLLFLQRSAPPTTQNVAKDDPSPAMFEPRVAATSTHRTSVAFTGDAPTIIHELPTERDDVTIVWLYDAPKSTQPAEPRTEPVGVVPTTEIHATGTHS